MIAVLIVEDYQPYAEALASRLDTEQDLQVVGIARLREAPALIARLRPEVVLVDVGTGGEELTPLLAIANTDAPAILLLTSVLEDPGVALSAAGFRARAVISKTANPPQIARQVRLAGGGSAG